MAKKKQAEPITPADQKQFLVTKKFSGEINNRPISGKVGDVIMLNPFEAECLKTYTKEQE